MTASVRDSTGHAGTPWWGEYTDNRLAPWAEDDNCGGPCGAWPVGAQDQYMRRDITGPTYPPPPGWVARGADDQVLNGLGDLVHVIEGLSGLGGPPYAYYGGSAFVPKDLPPVGAMWLPGHRLATKMPGNKGTVFHANGPFVWEESDGTKREYPDFPGAQPIRALEPTGWDIRTGEYARGHYMPGDVGPSVSGLGGARVSGFGQGNISAIQIPQMTNLAPSSKPATAQETYQQQATGVRSDMGMSTAFRAIVIGGGALAALWYFTRRR